MAGTVCVTGAAGYLGTELVKQLLEKGYTVHGTVRAVSNQNTYKNNIETIAAAFPGCLKLFKADLLQEHSFDAAIEGCTYVFHTASPFKIDVPDPQTDLIEPAVQGTRSVLASVLTHMSTVKRVVLTSSVAAVHGEYAAAPKSGSLYTEEDWNETSSVENGQAYHLSKVLAEKDAWATAKAGKIDLVTILPNFILGPPASTRVDGLSVDFFKGILEGSPPSGAPIICDVRDVARCHILAAETPSASGRYIVSHTTGMLPQWTTQVLRQRFPDFKFASPEDVHENPEKMDNRKLQELGLKLRDPAETIVDMATTLISLGIAKPQTKHA